VSVDCDEVRAALRLTEPCCQPCHFDAAEGDVPLFDMVLNGQIRYVCCAVSMEAKARGRPLGERGELRRPG